VDPLDLWKKPPFEPLIEGDTIYARGASDDKGQFLIHLLAAEACLKTKGSLPVNLKFIIEGEEETAADNLEGFIKENHGKLKADGVVVSDTAMYGRGVPAITYGLRGIAVAEIKVHGPGRDLHSGSFGGAVANPATEVARIVAGFHDADCRVRIDGFYDRVRALEEWERDMFKSLPFDEKEYIASTGSPGTAGEKGFTTLERTWGRPTCEVNGIYGGYHGDGSKTIIPAWAGCKVTMRLVPDQDPEDILDRFETHVRNTASPAVRVEVKRSGGAKPAIVTRESFLVQGGSRALEKGFGKAPVFIREGGSIPIVNVFKEELGLDTLLLGFGQHDDNAHSPNEKFSLADFHQGIVTAVHLFDEVK
jgi:acetylornithine deacetylase/succinyl-diaminopimelate desuccinylase-like protein